MKRIPATLFLGLLSVCLLLPYVSPAADPAVAAVAETATAAAEAAEAPPTVGQAIFATHNLWIMIAAALVFIMHLGFACLESGLTRAKNTTNILFKNVMVVCIGTLTFCVVGFSFGIITSGKENWRLPRSAAIQSRIS